MEAISRVSQLVTRYSLLYQAIKCQELTHTLELPAMHRDKPVLSKGQTKFELKRSATAEACIDR